MSNQTKVSALYFKCQAALGTIQKKGVIFSELSGLVTINSGGRVEGECLACAGGMLTYMLGIKKQQRKLKAVAKQYVMGLN